MRKIKKRKKGLTVILLILVFSISIGYASLSTQLNMSGTVTIRYESSDVTVTFNANGGTVNINSKSVTKEAQYGELPTPTKEGYTFLGWSKKNIPTEYQEVEYIKFNNGQYIDTGIVPSNHSTEVKFDFETQESEVLFGTQSGAYYYHFTGYENEYWWGENGNQYSAGTWSTGIHTIIFNGENNSIKLDNEILASDINSVSTNNLLIGKRSEDQYYLQGKVYYVKIVNKTTGELVRDMVPCYRKEDNVIGLYDMVEGNFYTNQGTGLFTKGENVNSYVTETTIVPTNENHTLYAIWEKDTLLINLDGINNTLSGHNSNSSIWYDISGTSNKNAIIQSTSTFGKVAGNTIWEEDSLRLDGNTYYNLSTPRNDFYGTVEVEVEIDSDFTPQNSNNWYECSTIFGCELSGTQKDWAIIIDKSGYFAFGYSTSTIYSSTIKANDGNKHTVSYTFLASQLIFKVDGEVIGTINYTASGSAISTYGIGWNKSSENTRIKGNIYDLKVYTPEDELIVHLDGVNNILTGHSSDTEIWYNLVEYLNMFTEDALRLDKNNNKTITVDSPVDDSFGTVEIEVEIDSDFVPINSNSWYECSTIFGCELFSTQKDWAIIIDKNGNFAFGYSTQSIYSSTIKANDGNKHTVSYSYTPTKLTFKVDGEVVGTINYTPYGTAISTFGIGWNNDSTTTKISGKIYSIKFYDDE